MGGSARVNGTNGRVVRTSEEQSLYIEELKQLNDELKQARRAALNLMEDAIQSKEALRQAEEKYRNKLELDVNERTAEVKATKEILSATLDSTTFIIQAFKAVRDKNGKIIDFVWVMNNRQAAIQNGDVIGKSLLKQNPGVIGSGLFAQFIQVTETGVSVDSEQFYNHDQFNGWYHHTLTKMGDGFVSSTENIDEKRRIAEEILHLKDEIAQAATDKYRSLYNSMEEGFTVIEMMRNENGHVVNYNYTEANPAFTKLVGLKPEEILGKPVLDILPSMEGWLTPTIKKINDIGHASRSEHFLDETQKWYEVLAYPMANDQVAILYNDVTERRQADAMLRESDERKSFLLKISDTLRSLSASDMIQEAINKLAISYFGADRCYYSVIKEDKAIITRDAATAGLPSVSGIYLLEQMPILKNVIIKGKPFVVSDVRSINIDEGLLNTCVKLNVISLMNIPIVKSNITVGVFCIVQKEPREWTEFEVELAQEIAERTWMAMERANVEEELRASEMLLARELADSQQLQKISNQIIQEGKVDSIYDALVDSAMEIMHADFASIQILLPQTNELLLYAWKNFHPTSANRWMHIHANSTTTCGAALQLSKRVGIPDVNQWEEVSQKDLAEYRRSGIVSMQSTPLISRSGAVVGMISTHWRKVHHASERELALFEVLARQTADLMERKQSEEALRESEERLRIATNTARIFSWQYNIESDSYFFSDNARGILGIKALPQTAEEKFRLVHPDDQENFKEQFQTAISKRQGFAIDFRLMNDQGEVVWLSVHCRMLEDSPGTTGRLIGIGQDISARKQAEEAVRGSEERFRTLADAVPQLIWTNSADGEANYFNKRWYEFSGLDYERSIGAGWLAIVHPEDGPSSIERWNKALTKGFSFDTEFRLRQHDGNYCWFIGRNVPLKNAQGKVISWFGSATDIQHLKVAAEALSQSEARLKVTMESATDYAIITMDTERKVERWSSGAAEIFGYSEEEIIGKSGDIIFTDEDREAGVPLQEMQTAHDSGRAANERWQQRKDGSRFFMSGVMRPIINGMLSGYVKVARDVTEQKASEENLRILEERYRIALDSAEMATWDWNVIHNTVTWNDQHFYLLGLNPKDHQVDSEYFIRYVHEPDRERVIKALKRAVDETGVYHEEFRTQRADNNEIKWMTGYGKVVQRDGDKVVRMVGVMYDITERHIATEELSRLITERTIELQQSNENLRQFATIAAHDLQEPLRKLRLFTSVLQRFRENLPEEGQQLLLKTSRTAERMGQLISEVLQYSKIANGGEEFSNTNLDTVLRNVISDLEMMIQDTGATIIYDQALPYLDAVPSQMNQLFYNLIVNALKFRKDGVAPVVAVACNPLSKEEILTNAIFDQQKEYISITITDNGVGFDEKFSEQIFQIFERLYSVDEYEGTGIGLALCKKIVENHHGLISATSKQGDGARFQIQLPIKQAGKKQR